MEAIEVLMSEHRSIERVIEALEAFVASVRRGAGDQPELARFVRFIREFADGHHHAKEEGVLFQAMVEAGFPGRAGPIGMMLQEHDQGRRQVAVLASLAQRTAPWSAEDRELLSEAAGGYAELLRAHIHKEDAILYPMAEQRLSDELAEQVDERCGRIDAIAASEGRRAALEELGRDLVGRHVPGLAGAGHAAG